MSISAWALHPSGDAAVRLRARLVDQAATEEDSEEKGEEDDHQRPADELADDELPAEQQPHDDPELDHQVRRGEHERDRRGEVGALAEERARQRDGSVGAGGGRCAEPAGDRDRARRVVRQQPPYLAL
jgi:hypothetical protein